MDNIKEVLVPASNLDLTLPR